MEEQIKLQLMNELFSEIEEGWRDHRDRTLVYRLAEKHPELREELYEFFEDLILGDSADVVPAIAEAEDRVAQWIRSSGVDVAIAAAKQERHRTTTEPSRVSFDGGVRGVEETANAAQKKPASADTWIAFLRQRVHQPLPDIAKALPHVTVEYLVLVSRHPKVVPSKVCSALAASVERQWRISAEESLRYLTDQSSVVRAASRPRPFDAEPATFNDLLDRSALSPEAKNFWVHYADVE